MARPALPWERLDPMIDQLRRRGATIRSIARQLGVSERSVHGAIARMARSSSHPVREAA